jgi:hypothetical protein
MLLTALEQVVSAITQRCEAFVFAAVEFVELLIEGELGGIQSLGRTHARVGGRFDESLGCSG